MAISLPPWASRITLILHATALFLAVSMALMFFDQSLFSWHPTLMALGYLLFMAEGIASVVMSRHLVGEQRISALQLHALTLLPGLLCIAFGFYAIYQNKVNSGKPHFTSTHGKYGLVTLLLTVGAPLGGALSFRRLGLLVMFPEAVRPLIKMAHKNSGTLTFLLALVTIELILPKPWMNKGMFTPAWQIGVAVLGALVLALMAVAQPRSIKTQ